MSRRVLVLACALVYAFLMLPLLVVFPISLSSAPYMQFPPPGLSWQWYQRYLDDPQWIDATWRSLKVGGATAMLALLLGVPLSFALVRGRFAGRALLDRVALAPIIVPHMIFAVAVYGLFRIWELVRRRATVGAADLPWLVPAVCFVALQAAIISVTDAVPLQESGGSNSTLPFADLVPVVGDWTAWLPGVSWPRISGIPVLVVFEQVRALPELALMAALVVVALTTKISPADRRWERVAVALMALLAVSLGRVVYENPADLRTIADVAVMSWAVVLAGASKRVLTGLGVAAAVVWVIPASSLMYLL